MPVTTAECQQARELWAPLEASLLLGRILGAPPGSSRAAAAAAAAAAASRGGAAGGGPPREQSGDVEAGDSASRRLATGGGGAGPPGAAAAYVAGIVGHAVSVAKKLQTFEQLWPAMVAALVAEGCGGAPSHSLAADG